MLFNSYVFVALLVVTFGLYYVPALARFQVFTLLLASLVFYGYTQPDLVILLLVSITINAGTGYLLEYVCVTARMRWLTAAIGVAANLAILGFFKYASLLVRTFVPEAQSSDGIAAQLLHIPLPIGISFFTFQGISLVVDAYRGIRTAPDDGGRRRHLGVYWLDIAFFISFFPQLIAGPIVKAHEFLPQVTRKFLRGIQWNLAIQNLILGYFMKMVVADNLKDQTAWLAYPFFTELAPPTLIALLFGYSFQIFADFAGYSLIAIGLGHLFGYTLPINFNFPYIARSFSEFWTRWHISLSSFLREYLYIPLGGNRVGAARTYLNLIIVMGLGGLWHGAGWNYAVWGLFHGGLLAVERLLGFNRGRTGGLMSVLSWGWVFLSVSFAWLFFKLPSVTQVMQFCSCLLGNGGARNNFSVLMGVAVFGAFVVAYHVWHVLPERRRPVMLIPAILGVLAFLILTNSGTPGEFIYFQF